MAKPQNTPATLQALIVAFLDRAISVDAFERDYLRAFKDGTDPLSEDTYQALNGLFIDIDSYCGDAELRDENDIDEPTLRERARLCLERLGP